MPATPIEKLRIVFAMHVVVAAVLSATKKYNFHRQQQLFLPADGA